MSDSNVEQVIERAVADEQFRQQLIADPDSALAGYDLTETDTQHLSNLDEAGFDDFAGGLGDRTTK